MTPKSGENLRASAIKEITMSPIRKFEPKKSADGRLLSVSEYFGELTFGLGHMREKLSREIYNQILQTLEKGSKLSDEASNAIAQVVKDWAVSHGATHFCHWFQPMTGLTAEKHDSFVSIHDSKYSEISVIEKFSGGQLIQGEPDASSFPSGGMRSTFEARGYTAWDPGSPLFIIEGTAGKTLCIPSVFMGYHGQALDLKTPLLRSQEALSKKAVEFLKLVGDVDVKRVVPTLGAEQEYFLIDKRLACLRPDIIMSGRTVVGAGPPRGQQLEDHYFGSIPTRVKAFMNEAEQDLYRLGVPVKTRHNEVAPSQFELAPIFEDANISADHNSMIMESLRRVANRHGYTCLLHEKPFAGLNGSGKHCNWSMRNDKGENLLEPGKTPHQNIRFLAILSIVLKGVYNHAATLRASIASPGNDHRLGANEAPPAIISVFLGSLLSDILESIENGVAASATEAELIELNVGSIPNVSKDYTDRNRTSPFAFTGNKFEFRAVGSTTNISVPVAFLNAAVTDAFDEGIERLTVLLRDKSNRDEAIMEMVKEFVIESKAVRFEGDNYSDQWKQEAEARGLPILASTAEALKVYKDKDAMSHMTRLSILSPDEIESRYNVGVERYNKSILIEMQTLLEITNTHVMPAVEAQLALCQSTLDEALTDNYKSKQKERVSEMETVAVGIMDGLSDLTAALEKSYSLENEEEQMAFLKNTVLPVSDSLRSCVDRAEIIVDDSLWVLPKYREMLFTNDL